MDQKAKSGFRVERDTMGEMQVPESAYYGAQTQRAVNNFPISGLRIPRSMIAALGLIKRSAAVVNSELGLLDAERRDTIIQVAEEVERGEHDEHFVVDIFQTGSGTSSNMNTNEVIAHRANELRQGNPKFHPNDHVNMSQSSNDVFPTAIRVAAALQIREQLIPALETLAGSLKKKSDAFSTIVKTGRTHLMDATPITLGQEFSGYQSQVEHGIARVKGALQTMAELPLGGTAVGTGVNTPPQFSAKVIEQIALRTKFPFIEAPNHFEAQAAQDELVEMSGQLKTIACSLAKVANDIRWLGSGPRCGIGELLLPEVQPGSSIMPAKVNPVICESLLMVCAQVIGNDAAVTVGGYSGGIFELNVMMPVMAYNLLQSIGLLAAGATNFARQCIDGIEPNLERIHYLAEANISTVTALAPKIGYEKAAAIAKEAYKTGSSVREIALKHNLLPQAELDRVLDLLAMTKPGL
ncbi:MAG: class II fumarate hydratase [Bdellovibrionota bacterium]